MDQWEVKWQLLVADSWDDEDLKARLLSDPMAVCKERGIVPPEGVKICVVENSADTINLVLPEPPSDEALSEEELEGVAGGGFGLSIGGGGVGISIGGCGRGGGCGCGRGGGCGCGRGGGCGCGRGGGCGCGRGGGCGCGRGCGRCH